NVDLDRPAKIRNGQLHAFPRSRMFFKWCMRHHPAASSADRPNANRDKDGKPIEANHTSRSSSARRNGRPVRVLRTNLCCARQILLDSLFRLIYVKYYLDFSALNATKYEG